MDQGVDCRPFKRGVLLRETEGCHSGLTYLLIIIHCVIRTASRDGDLAFASGQKDL
jgi:hypothetical protein